jgi:phytol kinase
MENIPSWKTILYGGPIGIFWSYACLYFAGYLKRYRLWKTGYTRKVFHFLIFFTVFVLQLGWGTKVVCLFGSACSLIIFYAILRGTGNILYEAMAREKDEPHRTLYIITPYFATLIGGMIANILFGPVAIVGYLVTGLGDAIAEPIGTRFGKHQYRVPSLSSVKAVRSLEGSTAVFIASVLAIIVSIIFSNHMEFSRQSIFLIPLISFAGTLVEAMSPHGWDNATMQIAPSYLATLLL